MVFHGNLIICYVQDPENDRYLFQLLGGEVCEVSKDEFFARWEEYRAYEAERSQQNGVYRKLPVTMSVTRNVRRSPANMNQRRKRKSAYLMQQPMLAHG